MEKISYKALLYYITIVYIFSNISTILVTSKFIEPNSIIDYIYITRYINIEFLFFVLALLVILKFTKSKIIPLIISYFYVITTFSQTVSYLKGNDYITKLAIANTKHVDVLLGTKEIVFICLFVLFLLVPIFFKKNIRFKISNISISIILLILLFFILLPRFDSSFIRYYQKVQQATQISKLSPIFELYNLSKSYILAKDTDLSNKDIIKPVPVSMNDFSLNIHRQKKLNIIVFFVEGTSARLLNTYGGKYSKLTPNIDRFAQSSIKINNYFNHTAATYRGIHGQLCSIYPKFGGVGGWGDKNKRAEIINSKSSYTCLPEILDNKGYETVYFNPHFVNSSYFPALARKVGFQTIFSAEDSTEKFLNGSQGLNNEGLTDNQQFKAIEAYLKDRKSVKPLFLSAYTLETHAWVDVSKDGIKYGDGSNHTLNTLHNLDYAFGKFVNYIESSKYKNNTIIVLTADHAHYYEDSYIELMDKSYKKYFVDRIPLIIHYPNQNKEIEFDANSATSIDFAPSIIQLADIETKAKFIGRSIFNKSKDKTRLNISAIGNDPIDTFIIVNGKIYRNKFSHTNKKDLEKAATIVNNMRNHEL